MIGQISNLINVTLGYSSTLLLGSTGEIITEKSGNLNLGTPGIMCIGGVSGVVGAYFYTGAAQTINPILAVIITFLAAIVGSLLTTLIYSFLTITLKANQNVTGLALTTLGIGISDYMIAKAGTSFGRASKFFTSSLPFADDLGWFGELFFSSFFPFP